jgi:acyl-CoA reductase-like NAD-dependent aldehyde dehydrogenase
VADVPQRTGLLLDDAWEDRDATIPVLAKWSSEPISEQAVAPAVAALRVGDPLRPDTDLSCLIDEAAAVRVRARIDAEIAAGPDLIHVGVFTQDLDLALRDVEEVRAGAVLINESPTFRADHVPYGGVGRAGTTREGPRATIRELTEEKLVLLRPTAAR